MTEQTRQQPGSSERMATLLGTLDLTDMQKDLLRQRWLDQLEWTSKQARKARTSYLRLRIPVVVGGVAVPALVTVLLGAPVPPETRYDWLFGLDITVVRFLTFFVSLSVAAAAALEEVYKLGDRWRHYRRTAELLKTLGWQYLMLTGAFRRFKSHADAYVSFTERVEDVLNEDVEGYLGSLATIESRDRPRPEIIA